MQVQAEGTRAIHIHNGDIVAGVEYEPQRIRIVDPRFYQDMTPEQLERNYNWGGFGRVLNSGEIVIRDRGATNQNEEQREQPSEIHDPTLSHTSFLGVSVT
jgi:hypothetical protein